MNMLRPPIITIMGHVDHGKTSLLDKIRNTNLSTKEAGGITQSIGAYQINFNQHTLTFIDTPGHYAFSKMRARGSSLADIVVIVIAADDGVMPQTEEAYNHTKQSKAKLIVVINKIDLPGGNVEKIKSQIAKLGIEIEEFGGSVPVVKTSTITGEGINELLETIVRISDKQNLEISESEQTQCSIVEAYLDEKRGPVVHAIVRSGFLSIRDFLVADEIIGRIKSLKNWRGEELKIADVSDPVEILGFTQVPEVGIIAFKAENQKDAENLVALNQSHKEEKSKQSYTIYAKPDQNQKNTLINLIIKADCQGSLEVMLNELTNLNTDQVQFVVLHKGIGNINESDVLLAVPNKAIVIGFNINIDKTAEKVAKEEKIIYRLYTIIYEMIDELSDVVKGEVDALQKQIIGKARIKKLFKLTDGSMVAGCEIINGRFRKGNKVEIVRDKKILIETKIQSIRVEKDEVSEIKEGKDCGIKLLENVNLFEGDYIQAIGD